MIYHLPTIWVVGHPNLSLFIPSYLGSLHTNYIIFRKLELSKKKINVKKIINFFPEEKYWNPQEYSICWNENLQN